MGRRIAAGLVTGTRDFLIPTEEEQVADEGDLELITWVVIKKE
jgi:hypothetical protein